MAIQNITLPDGRKIDLTEWYHQPIYSTVEIGATDGINLRAFTYVPGGQVPRTPSIGQRFANDRDTNMVKRQGMNWDEAIIVYAVTYEIFGLSDAGTFSTSTNVANLVAEAPAVSSTNLKLLQQFIMLELVVGAGMTKPQMRCPLSYVGQSIGSPAWASGDNLVVPSNIAWSSGTAGNIHSQNQRKYELPVYIASDQNFFLRVFAPTGVISGLSQNIRFRFYLDGMKKRPVA